MPASLSPHSARYSPRARSPPPYSRAHGVPLLALRLRGSRLSSRFSSHAEPSKGRYKLTAEGTSLCLKDTMPKKSPMTLEKLAQIVQREFAAVRKEMATNTEMDALREEMQH